MSSGSFKKCDRQTIHLQIIHTYTDMYKKDLSSNYQQGFISYTIQPTNPPKHISTYELICLKTPICISSTHSYIQ